MDAVGLLRVKWQGQIYDLPAPAAGVGARTFSAHDAVAGRFNIPRDRLKLVVKGDTLPVPTNLAKRKRKETDNYLQDTDGGTESATAAAILYLSLYLASLLIPPPSRAATFVLTTQALCL